MLKKLWTFSLSVIAILLIVLISCSKQDPENSQEPSFTTVEVKGVSLNKTSADMQVGESMVLVATVLPSNASDKSVIWSSSNSDVVTVTNGSVTALSVGSATVTVITNSGGKTASCKINVKGDVAVESVTLSQESTQIAEGDTLRLTATVSPNNATNPSLEWTSTNATVATVNDGLVTALKAGDTQVIVKAVDGGKSDTCSVTVIANENFVHVTGISFSIPTSVIAVGESIALQAVIEPENATNKNVAWSSSNTGVATVDQKGTLTGIACGETTVSLTAEDGGLTASAVFTVSDKVPVTSITIENVPSLLPVGYMTCLTVAVQPENASDKSVIWTSSRPSVATVNDLGYVSGIAPGETVITAAAVGGNVRATCNIRVGIPVESIEFGGIPEQMYTGNTYNIEARIYPENATNKTLVWTSSNPSVATADNGAVTAIAPGEAEITVTADDGLMSESFRITVVETVYVTGVTIDWTPGVMRVGDRQWLNANVQPENATNRNVTWSTSNPFAVTVSEHGEVYAVAEGDAEITVTTDDGGKKATCKISVGIPVDWVEITNYKTDFVTGDVYTYNVNIHPEDATNKTLVWTSSNPSVASIDNGTITAISPGETEIIVTANNGIRITSFNVNVIGRIPVTSVTIENAPNFLRIGEMIYLWANVQPENATNKNVTWSTSNPLVATVNEDGSVYGISAGEVEITATSVDGGIKGSCKITVGIPVDWIEVPNIPYPCFTGDTYTLDVRIHPEDATDKTLAWSSSNPSVAAVENGVIRALSPGEVDITAVASNGVGTSIRIMVVNKVPVTGVTIQNVPSIMRKGDWAYLYANVQPENASVKNVVWSSSNPSVATVTEGGDVNAVSIGETEITATTVDGGFKSTCKIYVRIPVDWIEVTNTPPVLSIGETYTVETKVHPEEATDKTLAWSSSNPNVATVDNGVIKAISPGETEIFISADNGNCRTSLLVSVIKKVPVASVTIENVPHYMRESERAYLWANVQPEDATNKSVVWSSSNPSVAVINEHGEVYAVSIGETEITATAVDGGIKGTCKISVGIPVEWIDITNYRTEFVTGDVYTYNYNIHPENATNKTLLWTSSNPGVASIDNGTITALSPGETEIIVTANNGMRITSFNVNVIRKEPVTSVTIENVPGFLRVGDWAYLHANVQPENASNRSVVWSSSNPSVATVNEGGDVYAVSVGETEITATAVDGGIKGTCKISVRIPVDWVDVTNHRSEFFVGETYTYETKIYPENATDKTLVWNSSNPNVATVNNGVVRAISEGETEISYSANNGTTGNGWMISVRRYVPVTSVTIENVPGIIRVGEWAYLNANVQPEDAINKDVVWSSSNPAVATVNEHGHVYAVSLGETEITATAADNGIKSTRKITVGIPVESVDFTNFRNEFVVGEVFTYNVNVYPENATNKNLIWTSSNTSVVTVENGVLRAIAPGGAYVNIVPEDGCMGGYSHYVTVYSEYNPNGISLDNSYLEIIAGEKAKLSATVHPEYATNKNVIWSTTDPNVATVDNNGTVTAVAHGYCYIVATTEVGGCSTECQIYVPQVPVTGVSLDKSSTEIFVEQSVKLVANIAPANATNKNLHWESSNWDVATVENGIVKGVNPGVAVINVYTSEGWFNAQCTVTVKPNLVTGISLSKTSVEMTQEDEFTLVATITPNNATNKNVIWSSSSPESASVVNGVVKAIRAGEVTITAKTEDGGYTATCKFYIKAKNGVDVGEWGEGENNEGEAQ